MGKIHSIESFGAVDGPGIRFVIFLQGCPMRCQYCHNPDSWNINAGKEMSVEEIMQQVRKYKHYFTNGGGVTVSGGEPLIQIDFVTQLFKVLKAENIHTCIDTSGILFNDTNIEKFDTLIKYTNLVLLDIKHINSLSHKTLTGFTNDNVLNFARYLDKHNIPTWIRYVLVPTINDDQDSLVKLREFLDSLNNVKKIEILPYHTLGVDKYKQLGIDYPLKHISTPTNEQIEFANKILKGEYKW